MLRRVARHAKRTGRDIRTRLATDGNHDKVLVWDAARPHRLLVSWFSHGSNSLTIKDAERELRKHDLIPPVRQPKKEEEANVPRLTNEEAAIAVVLRERITKYLQSHSREDLYEKGFALIQSSRSVLPYTASGSSSAEDLCQVALKRFLDDKKGWKQINLDRWGMVMDRLEAELNGGAAQVDLPPAADEEEAQVTHAHTALDSDTVEMLHAAEEMLKEAERQRDDAIARADVLTQELHAANAQGEALASQKVLMEDQIAEFQRTVAARGSTIEDLTTKLSEAVERNTEMRRQHDGLMNRVDELTSEAARLSADIERYTVQGLDPAQDAEFRARYFDALLGHLVRAGRDETDIIAEFLPRLDRLTGVHVNG